jgi:redox-sensitive bicupin YhaK (pirin superfamily)
MSAPGYQTLLNRDIPRLTLPNGAGSVRVIAGSLAAQRGPASTFSPLNVWDMQLERGATATLAVPQGHIAALAVLRGQIIVNESRAAGGVGLVLLESEGDEISVQATQASSVLLLSGAPILEPIVGHGPFVMNTGQQIEAAMHDFRSGKFGRMTPPRGAPP